MEKRKLYILISLSILSIYGIARIEKLSATDSQSVTEKTITPPTGSSGPAGYTVYMPQTTTAQPNSSQLSQIMFGTFQNNAANVCPTTPNCGTPNTLPSRVGTSTCPTICYVSAFQIGVPPSSAPFLYLSCPKGYAVITPGNSDLYYQFLGPDSTYPSSQAALAAYQNSPGYTCNPDPATDIYNCPSGYAQGTYYPMNNMLYTVISTECRVAGSCWGSVSCGVAHSDGTHIQAMRCVRPAGYYPVQTKFGSTSSQPIYQTAPLSLICGLIYTQWSPS